MNSAAQQRITDTLAAIAERDRELQAFAAVHDADGARRELDRALAHGGALAGLPVGVKDIFDTATLPTAYASALYAGHRPRHDAAIVQAVRRAGGVVVGKTSTTEFAFLHPAPTLNPNAPGHTPGGSSAGSAAAVAAGLVPLAVGTQTGGSVVRPASYCGVVGFKPSFGALPTPGLKCFSWSLDTVGLFTRTVAEMAQCAQAIAGRPWATAPLQRTPVVGIAWAYPWAELSASARQALETARDRLAAAGVTVKDVVLPAWVGESFHAQDVIQGWEAARAVADEDAFHREALSQELRDYLAQAQQVSDAQYAAAQATAAAARARLGALFDGIDVLLTPSAPDEAPPLSARSTGASLYNRAWTLLHVPCCNVPGLTGVQGLPMGVQVIAPVDADALCLQAAAVVERAIRH